ncbi:hypothetical protein [Streptomyces kanasensis]
MPKVPESRRVGRMAVNEVRALLERGCFAFTEWWRRPAGWH